MVNSCRSIVWYQYWRNATEEFIHVDVGRYPCKFLLVGKALNKRILAIRHNANEEIYLGSFSGIRICNVNRISGPIYFDLFTRLSCNVHCSTALFLCLLYVIAELGIHERCFAGLSAYLKVFRPQKLFGHSVLEQFLADVLEIWKALSRSRCCFTGKQPFLQILIRNARIKRPLDIQFSSTFAYPCDGIP